MRTEEQVVVDIKEVINRKNEVQTTLILYVDYEAGEDKIERKKNSYRKIFSVITLNGEKKTTVYAADGFVSMDQIYEIHTEAFLSNFDNIKDTKITLIENN